MLSYTAAASAAEPTPGYPEPVIQWGVQEGETCDDIAKVAYGSAQHVGLLHRYNRITCGKGSPLPEGLTLVLPASVTSLPDARIRGAHPEVKARPSGGAWVTATAGMPLTTNASVNTLDTGRADLEFVDRSRIFLAPRTLVVIYGTASRSRVSKAPPAAVELEAGEIKAALAALRGGGTAEVEVTGGGRVSAASRDTVVQRKGERTTVAVFDGKAAVRSAGQAVEVPTNHGTRFTPRTPPAPPRPLPPAPLWAADAAPALTVAPGGEGILTAAWQPVAGAIGYRVEAARDAEFNDLIAREEVPPDILSFRGERLPARVYYLRVRAIDQEEYLGIGAVGAAHPVEVAVDAGEPLEPREIEATPPRAEGAPRRDAGSPPPEAPREPTYPVLGAWAPMLSPSPALDTLWLAPTPPDAASAGAALGRSERGVSAQAQARVSGSFGPLGLDAALRSSAAGDPALGSGGWAGARVRVLRLGRSELELAPALRAGFPLAAAGPAARIEPSLAAGGALGRLSWVADAGARIRLEDDGGASGVPGTHGFLLLGAAYEPAPWLRLHAALDGHLLDGDSLRGGVGLGAEAGGPLFGGVALRVGPAGAPGEGVFTGQVSIGVRNVGEVRQ